jgi:nucleotide-binding universal stress UspA family protein
MSAIAEHPMRGAAAGGPFTSIVCAAEPSDAGAEAVRQAARLAGAGAVVETVAFSPMHAAGAPRPVPRQTETLVMAADLAAAQGAGYDLHIVEAETDRDGMLDRCAGHDLLVAPAGPAVFAALADAPIPVLVARRPPEGVEFAESIVVAVDGTPASQDAVRVAIRLAAAQRARVALVAAPEHDAAHQQALLNDIAAIAAGTGAPPLVVDEHGTPARAIARAAASLDAALIVTGSRPGTPPGSVSAAVAERAACSVLVLRPGRPSVER